MSKTLVIVESPGKIAKISQYLGPDYIVKASFGHVQDLDKATLSIDVNDNFKPLYKVSTDKVKVVKELKKFAKDCSDIILAADGDREGEAIAFSLASVLNIKTPKRIIFHEITKNALTKAIEKPSTINYDMVHAQQARRLLDRLVGYLISPVLKNHIQSSNLTLSAGRVQSVVVRIIIDKEESINKSISTPYLKTCAEFDFITESDTVKLNSVLQVNNKQYQFESDVLAKEFLSLINKKTEFKVDSVENKKSIRKPSPPFITSSLQQEASTKLHFSVKRTMDVAQKLYEAGLITYMRSDSPNMSKDAISDCKNYIIETYGKEYSDPKNYESKNATSQDAHECIRPTHLNKSEPENVDGDNLKLYKLIWKRTMASQMSNAQVNVQTIQINAYNSKKSILSFDNQNTLFCSVFENIEFAGYLIVYDNTPENEDSKLSSGQLEIKPKTKLCLHKMVISEEYTKAPLRYNEALLVKYLEKNGIGRPSTYAAIISKVIERKYVEIKDITGIEKDSQQLTLDKKFKFNSTIKKVLIGKEQKKLVPTIIGNKVNDFMMTNFEPIMDIEFTANFETYLDKISIGKANWVTVLRLFYDMFNPIVEKLNTQSKTQKQLTGSSNDKLVGINSLGLEIFSGTGIYGPYVKYMDDKKWKYAPLKDIPIDTVTVEQATELLEYPKTLGKIGAAYVTLNKGPFGLYLKYCGKNISIKNESMNADDINIDYAREIIEAGDPYALKTFKVKDKVLNIKKGDFGLYIQIVTGTKKQNVSIPASFTVETITIDDVLKLIAAKNGTTTSKFKK